MKLQFIRNHQVVECDNVPLTRTLLQLLREDLLVTSCKEGCAEGDCGACTVVLAEPNSNGALTYKAVNACIRLASSVQGMALWTAQDIASGALHPVQQSMVSQHASQCGFCTPGFVMSLFALYQTKVQQGKAITRDDAQYALSGNLCRCTGYQSIMQAALSLKADPQFFIDEDALLKQLLPLKKAISLADFLQERHAKPEAQLVAGTTDVGLWINKQHKNFESVHDLTTVAELKRITADDDGLHIGAAATLEDAFAAMQVQRPQLKNFTHRFAGLPVRNSGTLGGNVANGSPIGDSMPLLISLGATVSLARFDGVAIQTRDLPLEKLYLGYRRNVFLPDEVLTHIHVPKPGEGEFSRVYKVSKRFEDDISAVCLAINMTLKEAVVQTMSIGAGGVAAVPARAVQTEALLVGKTWSEAAAHIGAANLQSEFAPISDMRASDAYRQAVLGQLMQRFWLETQGHAFVSLADITVIEELL